MKRTEEKAVKKIVRDRDGNKCTKCGLTNEQHIEKYGRQLQVHRLAPGSVYTESRCVTLCIPYHGPEPRSPRLKTSERKRLRGNEHVPGFAPALREWRRRRGMTAKMLAAASGCHWVSILMLESGRRAPSFRVVLELAHALGISIADLAKPPE